MSEYDIGCWNCKEPVTLEDRRQNDGDCPYCGCELNMEVYFLLVAAELDALKEFKQGVYQYLRECQPSTKEEIELYESFSHFIRSLDSWRGAE